MFDVEAEEDSLADILTKASIETYSFNNFGTGPEAKPDHIGNLHQKNIDFAVDIINQYQIDYVLFYSYGYLMAPDVLDRVKVKGTLLLDPCPKAAGVPRQPLDGNRVAVNKLELAELLKSTTPINDLMLDAHLKNLCTGDVLTTAFYPTSVSIAGRDKFLQKENIVKLYRTAVVHRLHTAQVGSSSLPISTNIDN